MRDKILKIISVITGLAFVFSACGVTDVNTVENTVDTNQNNNQTKTGEKKMGIQYSYKSYIPFGKEENTEIYVVRLAPSLSEVELEWLGEFEDYVVEVCKDGQTVKTQNVTGHKARITGLEQNTEYSLVVRSGSKQSLERLFATGDYKGKVINYLHPEDLQYSYSGRFLASPSIVRFKGDLYVSMDCFRKGDQVGGFNLTLLFRSKDDGKTWDYVTDLVPCFWGTLFVANDKLCMLATSTEYGSLLVSSSDDGENWATPTVLCYSERASVAGNHKSAVPALEYDGKIYIAVEFGGYEVKRFDSRMAVYDMSKDVLDYDAWTLSDTCMVEHEWGGDPDMRYAIEGNAVERDGEIYTLLRFTSKKALMLKFDKNNPQKPPEFYKVVNLPIGHCKFYIVKDKDGTFYAMGNDSCYPRHIVQLYKSKDLEKWDFVKTVKDVSMLSAEKDGIQYPSYVLENGKMYTVFRTGLNGADTFHNTNAITFDVVTLK